MIKRGRGRESTYDPKYIDAVDNYIRNNQDEYINRIKYENEKTTVYEPKLRVKLPMVEDFATYIGVNKTTLYDWAKKYPDFANSLSKIVEEQKKRLINNSISGEYSPIIAKLILSANHGMNEKTETEVHGHLEVVQGFNYIKPQISQGPKTKQIKQGKDTPLLLEQ